MLLSRLSRVSTFPQRLWRLAGKFTTEKPSGEEQLRLKLRLRQKALVSSHIINMLAD